MKKFILIIAFAFLFTPLGAFAYFEVSDSSLQGYWKFDGDFTDESPNNFDGTQGGSAGTSGANAFLGESLQLDGADDHVVLSSSSLIHVAGTDEEFTINIWARPEDLASQQRILARPHTSCADPYWMYMLAMESDGKFNYGLTWAGNRHWIKSSSTISADTWYMLSMTWDGPNDEARLYLNGTYFGGWTISGDLGSNSEVTSLGKHGNCESNFFNGQLDEFSYLNKELSDLEIAELYNGGAGNPICQTEGCGSVVESGATISWLSPSLESLIVSSFNSPRFSWTGFPLSGYYASDIFVEISTSSDYSDPFISQGIFPPIPPGTLGSSGSGGGVWNTSEFLTELSTTTRVYARAYLRGINISSTTLLAVGTTTFAFIPANYGADIPVIAPYEYEDCGEGNLFDVLDSAWWVCQFQNASYAFSNTFIIPSVESQSFLFGSFDKFTNVFPFNILFNLRDIINDLPENSSDSLSLMIPFPDDEREIVVMSSSTAYEFLGDWKNAWYNIVIMTGVIIASATIYTVVF